LLKLASSRSKSRSIRRLVSSVIFAQQDVDEFPFLRDQFPCQGGPRERDVVSGIERIGKLVSADLVPGTQELYDFIG
jgi:hypothetical protein